MTSIETANKVLDLLKLKTNWTPTIDLLEMVGIKDTTANREVFRKILVHLLDAGHLLRNGSMKFSWKVTPRLLSSGWNRQDPFDGDGPDDSGRSNLAEQTGGDDMDDDDLSRTYSRLYERGNGKPEQAAVVDNAKLNAIQYRVKELEDHRQEHCDEMSVLKSELEVKENRLDQLEKLIAKSSQTVKVLKIEEYTGKVRTLKDVILPSYFQDLVDLASCRRNILLVGPAGCGKTTVAELLAKTLGLVFGKVGGSAGLSETHLLGKSNYNLTKGTEKYRPSEFVTRYEQGGLMLIDELDAADQNVLLVLNPALDRSGMLPLVNRIDSPLAKKHKDFVCVATANTFGRGAEKIYAGRNQLDGATLDRFTIGTVECYYESGVEQNVCPSKGTIEYISNNRNLDKVKRDEEMYERVEGLGYGLRGTLTLIRDRMEEASIRRIMSTRFMEDAWVMHESKAKWTMKKILKQYFSGWTQEEKSKVLSA